MVTGNEKFRVIEQQTTTRVLEVSVSELSSISELSSTYDSPIRYSYLNIL